MLSSVHFAAGAIGLGAVAAVATLVLRQGVGHGFHSKAGALALDELAKLVVSWPPASMLAQVLGPNRVVISGNDVTDFVALILVWLVLSASDLDMELIRAKLSK